MLYPISFVFQHPELHAMIMRRFCQDHDVDTARHLVSQVTCGSYMYYCSHTCRQTQSEPSSSLSILQVQHMRA